MTSQMAIKEPGPSQAVVLEALSRVGHESFSQDIEVSSGVVNENEQQAVGPSFEWPLLVKGASGNTRESIFPRVKVGEVKNGKCLTGQGWGGRQEWGD